MRLAFGGKWSCPPSTPRSWPVAGDRGQRRRVRPGSPARCRRGPCRSDSGRRAATGRPTGERADAFLAAHDRAPHRTTTNSSKFMIALTTMVIAARSTASSAASARATRRRPAACAASSAVRSEQRPLLVEQPREDPGFGVVRRAADQRAERQPVARRAVARDTACSSVLARARAPPRRTADRSAAPATAAAWSSTSRLAVQTSRDIASNVIIDGGGDVRRQNVYRLRRYRLVAGVLLVGLAGARLLPEARRLIRLHARPADRAVQQAARRQRAVADRLGGQPRASGRARAAGCPDRARAIPAGACDDCWNVADVTISRCSAFTSQPLVHEPAGQPVEQLGMRRQPALAAEVLLRRDDAAAEVHPPDAIDGDAGGQRIVAVRSASARGRGGCAAGPSGNGGRLAGVSRATISRGAS